MGLYPDQIPPRATDAITAAKQLDPIRARAAAGPDDEMPEAGSGSRLTIAYPPARPPPRPGSRSSHARTRTAGQAARRRCRTGRVRRPRQAAPAGGLPKRRSRPDHPDAVQHPPLATIASYYLQAPKAFGHMYEGVAARS
jgi:hypothetical protein